MMRFKRIIFVWVPTFLWMGLIFWLSSFPKLRISEGLSDLVLRKLAHMTEYAILFCLFYRSLKKTTAFPQKRSLLLALILTILYAATDEYHQTFVLGRAGRVIDVGIDSLGALGGLIFSKKYEGKNWWLPG